jgi:hypothetical protein
MGREIVSLCRRSASPLDDLSVFLLPPVLLCSRSIGASSAMHLLNSSVYCLHAAPGLSLIQLTLSRPKTIEDVSSQENTVAVLRKALASTNVRDSSDLYMRKIDPASGSGTDHGVQLPHMLFYGPPGTGKTSGSYISRLSSCFGIRSM